MSGDFINYVEDGTAPKNRVQIEIPGINRPVGAFATELARHYRHLESTILFYNVTQREVVRLGLVSIDKKEGLNIKILGFIPVHQDEFITMLETNFELGKWRKTRQGDYFDLQSISSATANAVLKSQDQFRENLPIIQRIYKVQMPIIEGGKLQLTKKGYDKELLSWVPDDSPIVRLDMSLDEAIVVIDKIFGEFCFKDRQDKINAIAALLTPYCRYLYTRETARTPLFVYMGNRERAGKDYCAGITGIVYEGMAIEDSPVATEHENHGDEFRKKMLATLKIGRTRIHSSNNKGFVNNAELEAAITNEYITDRQLGQSSMLTFPNIIEFSMSANIGITYTPDFSKRSVFINFFFAEEDPNARKFTMPNLHEWVFENRGDVLSALYALVRDWMEKGSKPGSQAFASFPEWARVVGGIMENANYGFPTSNDVLNAIGGDKETADMKAFFEICHRKWGEQYITKPQIYQEFKADESEFNGLFTWLDWDEKEGSAKSKFARMLEKYDKRIFSNIILDIRKDPANVSRNKYGFIEANKPNQEASEQKDLDDFEV